MAGLIPFNKRNSNMPELYNGNFYNMLDDFFNDSWFPSRSLVRDTFKIDVEENDREYLVTAELPGIKKEELSLNYGDGRLTIGVTHEENVDEQKKNYIHRERRRSSMSRSVYLADAQSDSIKAKLDNGVLCVAVAKQEKAANSRSIDIE